MKPPKRAFVTGGAGFIGSRLVKTLLDRGYGVTCLVRRNPWRLKLLQDNVQLVRGDLLVLKKKELANALKKVEPNVVFHLAGVKTGRKEDLYVGNTVVTRNLLEACAQAGGPFTKIVVVSSLAAVGPPADGVAAWDNDPCRPVSVYGWSKAEEERVCAEFTGRLPVVIVRPPIVYGPGDKAMISIFRMVRFGLKPILAPGQRLSIIHVRDLVDGLVAVAERGTIGKKYFLAHKEVLTERELINLIGRVMGVKKALPILLPPIVLQVAAAVAQILSGGRSLLNLDKVREITESAWVCDVSSATSEQLGGWRALIPHADGLLETARWYQEKGWL